MPGMRAMRSRGFIKLLGARAVVAGLTGIQHEKREVSGLESGVDGVLPPNAAEEETSNHEQDEGNGNLAGEQGIRQAYAPARTARGASLFFQCFGYRGARRAERRNDAKNQAGKNGDRECKEKDVSVELQLDQVESVFRRTQRGEQLASSVAERESE